MKYMGSKRWMLQNGLGEVLRSVCSRTRRFVDLFAGSGAVACHVAQNYSLSVLASDLQEFSVVLTRAVIGRRFPLDATRIWARWFEQAKEGCSRIHTPSAQRITHGVVRDCRAWSESQDRCPITQAYGGHYFSPTQAVWIDLLRRALPEDEPTRTVALAALICAASRCAASPGHTAQPFQPTRSAKPHLQKAWEKDIVAYTRKSLSTFASQFAREEGEAIVSDANDVARTLTAGDIAFIDPPYSGVQYSRFYHVLETIARGRSGRVSGVGRYPPRSLRPQSKFSVKTHSLNALEELLQTVAERHVRAVLTFPEHDCSNGLSGSLICDTAGKFFRATVKEVERKFSTLGGNNKTSETGNGREARQTARELILVLKPRD
ncbi:MAG: adenine methyltransferase [Planctomycetes bacterium]|nr:adenine methyltransferase [Planctomycetota bacterium]